MPWQHRFHSVFGTGLFGGITAGDWCRALRANGFRVSPRYAPRCAAISACSLANSVSRQIEEWRYGSEIAQQQVPAPLFILGHWRSGTTHLHNLIAHDTRFAYPNLYQVLCPHTFLTSETVGSRLLAAITPETRFGIDNVKMGPDIPYEDEFAIATMTLVSPYVSMSFPERQQFYDRFLTLRDASAAELRLWQQALTTFVAKLTWKYRRPLVLKSPPHTCRIRLLLEQYPSAKFVHIRRHPFDVYRSTRKMVAGALVYWQLQPAECVDWDERIVRQHREMYDVYFEERQLIPDGHLHEVTFEELDADPVGAVRGIYEGLRLPDFEAFRPNLVQYVDSLRGYQKNAAVELPLATRQRLAQEWRRCFEEWGYWAGTT